MTIHLQLLATENTNNMIQNSIIWLKNTSMVFQEQSKQQIKCMYLICQF